MLERGVCELAHSFFHFIFFFGVFRRTREFSSFRDVTIADEGLQVLTCSALIAIEQLGFFSVPHGAYVYNGHDLRGPVTLIPNAKLLAVDVSLPVLTT